MGVAARSQVYATPRAASEDVLPIVRWALCAFVFSLLFEAAPLPVPVEMTKITGGLLVLAALLQPGVCFRFPSAAAWCFALFLCVGIVSLLWQDALGQEGVAGRLVVFGQLVFLFWIAANLLRHERVARAALVSLASACVVLSVLGLFGLVTPTATTHNLGGRLASFGLDPNQLAGLLALGLLVLIGLTYGDERSGAGARLFVWPLLGLVGMTLLRTGSRGGLLAFAVGLLVFTLSGRTFGARARNTLIVLLGIASFLGAVYQSDAVRRRFESTLATGNLTARELIFPTAWQMFMERPLLGWGVDLNAKELGERLMLPAYPRMDPHNLVLYVLTTTGIAGAIPFFAGVWLCLRAAWRGRGGPRGILPLALAVSLLVADMSVSGLHWKQHWLILAYALASGEET